MELTAFWFGLYKLVKYVLSPLTWVTVLLGFAALLALLPSSPRRVRWLRLLALLSCCLLVVVSSPIFADLVFGLLESWHSPVPLQPGAYDAIVVLGGGVRPAGSLRPVHELTDYSRHRTACAADLFVRGMAPRLLLSGGDAVVFGRGPQEAEVMKQWAMRLGVPASAILLEDRSRTTYENAVESRRMLGPASILLVTSAMHLPRAVALFEKQGFRVTPSPCGFYAKNRAGNLWDDVTLFSFLPSSNAVERMTQAIAEVAGIALYRLTGKM